MRGSLIAYQPICSHAEVVKLVDTLASGASGGNPVEVQVLSSAPFQVIVYKSIIYLLPFEVFIRDRSGVG